jgi:hypothetical protein
MVVAFDDDCIACAGALAEGAAAADAEGATAGAEDGTGGPPISSHPMLPFSEWQRYDARFPQPVAR